MYELNFILKKIDFKKYNTELDIIKMEKYNSEDAEDDYRELMLDLDPDNVHIDEEYEIQKPNFKEIIAARSKEITKINHARFKEEEKERCGTCDRDAYHKNDWHCSQGKEKEEFPEVDEITKGLEEYAKQHPEADIGKFN